MRRIVFYVVSVSVLILLTECVVDAAPIRLYQSEFEEVAVGRTTIVEDFQGFAEIGLQADSFPIANGIVTGTRPFISELTSDLSRALTCSNAIASSFCSQEPVTFTDFSEGTVAWGSALPFAGFVGHRFDVTVIGESGTFVETLDFGVTHPPSAAFIAFGDELGLLSVKIESRRNFFVMQDITTVSVPEPSAMALASIALFAFSLRRRFRFNRFLTD